MLEPLGSRGLLGRIGVVQVLGLGQALGDQGLHRVGAAVEGEREFLPLGGGEVPEHEVGRVHPARRAADAEADPVVVTGAEGRGDRAQAIVAVVAAAQLQADPAERDVELVMEHPGPAGRPSAMSLRVRFDLKRAPIRSASRASTIWPTLCLVPAYSGPGLPSPTMIHRSSAIGCSNMLTGSAARPARPAPRQRTAAVTRPRLRPAPAGPRPGPRSPRRPRRSPRRTAPGSAARSRAGPAPRGRPRGWCPSAA